MSAPVHRAREPHDPGRVVDLHIQLGVRLRRVVVEWLNLGLQGVQQGHDEVTRFIRVREVDTVQQHVPVATCASQRLAEPIPSQEFFCAIRQVLSALQLLFRGWYSRQIPGVAVDVQVMPMHDFHIARRWVEIVRQAVRRPAIECRVALIDQRIDATRQLSVEEEDCFRRNIDVLEITRRDVRFAPAGNIQSANLK